MDSAKERFSSLMSGAEIVSVDPMACIPFTCVRDTVNGCVQELARIFDDEEDGGVTSGGSMCYVIRLEGAFSSVPLQYFRKELASEDAAQKEVSKRKEWFGIVDGAHLSLIHI